MKLSLTNLKSTITRPRMGENLKFLWGVVIGLLVVRFIMRLFDLEASNPVAGLIYGLTGWLVAPAKTLLKSGEALPGAVLEIQTLVTLFAMAIGTVLLAALLALIKLKDYPHIEREKRG